MSASDCNYMKTRDGNYSFCPSCYSEFIDRNNDFFNFYKSREIELKRSFWNAIESFHDEMAELESPLFKTDYPTVLIHSGPGLIRRCNVCREILKYASKNMDEFISCFKEKLSDE